MYPNSHLIRIPAPRGHSAAVTVGTDTCCTGRGRDGLCGPLELFLHKNIVGPELWLSPANCGMDVCECVCASACAVGKELRTAFVNISTVELFKVYVLFKHVPNVMQDRNKDVKVKTVTFDFLNIEPLAPSTGDSMPLLRKNACALHLLETLRPFCCQVLLVDMQYCVDCTTWD